jgi:hypothetical protein
LVETRKDGLLFFKDDLVGPFFVLVVGLVFIDATNDDIGKVGSGRGVVVVADFTSVFVTTIVDAT